MSFKLTHVVKFNNILCNILKGFQDENGNPIQPAFLLSINNDVLMTAKNLKKYDPELYGNSFSLANFCIDENVFFTILLSIDQV